MKPGRDDIGLPRRGHAISLDRRSPDLLPTQLDPRCRVTNCPYTGDAVMNDLLRDYRRWNNAELVGVAVIAVITVVAVAVGLS